MNRQAARPQGRWDRTCRPGGPGRCWRSHQAVEGRRPSQLGEEDTVGRQQNKVEESELTQPCTQEDRESRII